MIDAATAVEVQEAPVTLAPTRKAMSEASRKKLSETKKAQWAAKKAAEAALTPAKTKGLLAVVQLLEAQKAKVKMEYAQKVVDAKTERDEVLASLDELIADAKAKAQTK